MRTVEIEKMESARTRFGKDIHHHRNPKSLLQATKRKEGLLLIELNSSTQIKAEARADAQAQVQPEAQAY